MAEVAARRAFVDELTNFLSQLARLGCVGDHDFAFVLELVELGAARLQEVVTFFAVSDKRVERGPNGGRSALVSQTLRRLLGSCDACGQLIAKRRQ
jgi:hypothetical protein